jgi:threonine/homoserine/homoserine lactone efflux protein
MLAFFSQAAGFGFVAGTSFGPLHTLLMNVTLSLGWRQGMLIVLSPLLTDAPIIVLMLIVLQTLPPAAVALIQIVGGLVVLQIAWRSWRAWRAGPVPVAAPDERPNLSRETLLKGMAVNFLNPAPYLFWGTIMGPILLDAMRNSGWHALAFLVGFYGTFLGLMVIFVVVLERLRRLDPRFTRGLLLISVVVLVILGLNIFWQGLQGLVSAL